MRLVSTLFPGEGSGGKTVAIGFRRPCPLLHLTVTVDELFNFCRLVEERIGLFSRFKT